MTTFKTVTPYRNRERRVDFVWNTMQVDSNSESKPVAKANVIPLAARVTGEANYVPQRKFGNSSHKRAA